MNNSEHLEQVAWKDIPGYEGLYQINKMGQVKNIRFGREMPLKPGLMRDYYGYRLSKNGKSRTERPNRLVLMAFARLPNENEQANHKNGDKLDNRLDNLEWVTPSENVIHSFEILGREKPVPPRYFGQNHPRSKITNKQAKEIYLAYKKGEGIASLARKYNIGETTVRHLVKGDTWKCLNMMNK